MVSFIENTGSISSERPPSCTKYVASPIHDSAAMALRTAFSWSADELAAGDGVAGIIVDAVAARSMSEP